MIDELQLELEQTHGELEKALELVENMLEERDALANQKAEAERAIDEMKLEKEQHASATSAENELLLLQLHQLQEELRRYFHKSRGKDELFKKNNEHQQRTKKLISTLMAKIS